MTTTAAAAAAAAVRPAGPTSVSDDLAKRLAILKQEVAASASKVRELQQQTPSALLASTGVLGEIKEAVRAAAPAEAPREAPRARVPPPNAAPEPEEDECTGDEYELAVPPPLPTVAPTRFPTV